MRIGDIEYTRSFASTTAVANTSVRQSLRFAVGIKVRALMTRVQCFQPTAGAGTGGAGVFLENGGSVPAALSIAALADDERAMPVFMYDQALSTNGLATTPMFESLWWKILLPDVTMHFVSSVLAAATFRGTLHYRFAELTDDEIVEIAAQRAQS